MVGLESMQGMQREFQTICLTKLSNTCRQTQVQAGGERSEPPCLYVIIMHHLDLLLLQMVEVKRSLGISLDIGEKDHN